MSLPGGEQLDWVTVTWFFLAWCVFWPLSILSKETGILLPGFVAIYELIVRRSERGSGSLWEVVLYVSIALTVVLIAPYLVSPFMGNWILSGYDIRSFSLVERLLTEPRVISGILALDCISKPGIIRTFS